MRTLSSEIKTEIDRLNQPGRWAKLFQIKVDTVTTLFKTDYPIALTYNAQVYDPYPIALEAIEQTSKPENKVLTVNVANIDRTIATFLEEGKLLNNDVIIISVFVRQTDDTVISAFEEKFQILSAEVDNETPIAVFEIGKKNVFRDKLPHERWIDLRCRHVYKSIDQCHYGREEFLGCTQVNIKTGADGPLMQGWVARNFTNAGVTDANINITAGSKYRVIIATSFNATIDPATRNAPYLYRILKLDDTANVSPDWDIESGFDGDPGENGESEGIFVTDNLDSYTEALYWASKHNGTNQIIIVQKIDASVISTPFSATSTHKFLRMKKAGSTYTFYSKANVGDAWTQQHSLTKSQLSGVKVRIGVACETNATGRSSVFNCSCDFFRMVTGGYLLCNRSLEDCTARENVRRFGGAPGIIHGPLIL